MFEWLRRRRLSNEARKRLLLVAARAEEALYETHVANLLDLIDSLGEEVDLDRAMELYVEMVDLDEARASTVNTRLLARLESRKPKTGRAGRYRNVFRDDSRK